MGYDRFVHMLKLPGTEILMHWDSEKGPGSEIQRGRREMVHL